MILCIAPVLHIELYSHGVHATDWVPLLCLLLLHHVVSLLIENLCLDMFSGSECRTSFLYSNKYRLLTFNQMGASSVNTVTVHKVETIYLMTNLWHNIQCGFFSVISIIKMPSILLIYTDSMYVLHTALLVILLLCPHAIQLVLDTSFI